jgi:hypothetical protein
LLSQELLKRENINMSMAKISNYLTNRSCIHGTHKFGPIAAKGYKGLRQIEKLILQTEKRLKNNLFL